VPRLNHKICNNCGYYKGRMILDVKADIEKKNKKLKERAKEAGSK
jgi:hypothetical protein